VTDHFAAKRTRIYARELFFIVDVSNEMCWISQRYSAMNQIGFSVVIQWRSSNRARFSELSEEP